MKLADRTRILTSTFLFACTLSACGGSGSESAPAAGSASEMPAGGVPAGWQLVWSDEFNVDGLPDSSHWNYDTDRNQAGWYNNELQYYARDRADNAVVKDGRLLITARMEDLSAMPDWGGQRYSSARLVTRGKVSWTYGFYEIRAKLPCGRGTWPAIWMLGTGGAWPDDGEIDIMEQVGSAPSNVLGTIHTAQLNHTKGTQRGANTQVVGACNAFHNYQLQWTKDRILIGVDGSYYFKFDNTGGGYGAWPFDRPQYLLLNLAIGGSLGGSVDNSIFPAQMEVDYVRIYQPGI